MIIPIFSNLKRESFAASLTDLLPPGFMQRET